MQVVIVSGLSGSGKSVALAVLEDNGYNCIDNLPVALLPELLHHLNNERLEPKVAVGIDSRNSSIGLQSIERVLQTLKQEHISIDVLFLYAELNILRKRFSETRRKHPLSNDTVSLKNALIQESMLLEPIMDMANYQIDTSETSLYELRDLISHYVSGKRDALVQIQFESFGFKYGTPPNADFVYDVRFLPNPYWVPELRPLTGKDSKIIDYFLEQPEVSQTLQQLKQTLDFYLENIVKSDRSYVIIGIGCTGGKHRSVFVTEALFKYFEKKFSSVQIKHREIEKT